MAIATTTALLIAGTVIAAGSASYSAYTAQDNARDAKKAADKQAAQETEAARKSADEIREKAARLKGAQAAALAGSGVKLDSGTAGALLTETDRLSEQDVIATLREGQERASLIREGGALTAGNMRGQAISSALSGVASIVGGIRDYKSATAGTTFANQLGSGLATRTAPKYSILNSRELFLNG